MRITAFLCLGVGTALQGVPVAAAPAEQAEAIHFFEKHVRPLLIEHCYECHSEEAGEASGELLLDSRQAVRRGGIRGPAVVPGNTSKSLLLDAVRYDDPDLQMPPQGKLPADAIQILSEWIARGAVDPRDKEVGDNPEASTLPDPSQHWAFQPPRRLPINGETASPSEDPIDVRIARKAEAAGVPVADRAAREVAVRRLYFDLVGIAPRFETLQRILDDERPDALRRLTDRLLADPRFGDRWGRHWMDVARYADTIGYALAGREREIKQSHRYRDWIIDRINRDLPYDQFVRLQIAADQISEVPEDRHALGLLTIGRRFINNRQLIIDDQIDVVTRGLMGMTVACARCHDHKFDPIPTADYYALYGIFNSTERMEDDSAFPLAVADVEKPRDHPILVRGSRGNRGPTVPRQFLTILRDAEAEPYREGSGRRQLADAIARESNPLTHRVWVNRVWGSLFGSFLVDTPSDFGLQAAPPLHADVLDDLTVGFIEAGFSTKRLIRRIVSSATYLRSSVPGEGKVADPENRYFARAPLRRRDFESLRDSLLASAGSLDEQMFGPSQRIEDNPARPRRTVYAYLDRQDLPGVLRVFDVASPDTHSPRRYYTTVPQQALFLMNGRFAAQQARRTAFLVNREIASGDDAAYVERVFERVLKRRPTAAQRKMSLAFLKQPTDPADRPINPIATWRYGTAEIDEGRIVNRFRPLPVFRNGRWQGPQDLPDPEYGWTSLSAKGGHPGQGLQNAAVRRWIAPAAGSVSVDGYVSHPSKKGNGVRLSIVAGGKVRRSMTGKGNRFPYRNVRFEVAAGDAVDFVADDNGDTSFDSFEWSIAIHLETDDGRRFDFDSQDDFITEPVSETARPLDRREQLAQMLLLSNEFAFVE